MTKTLRRALIVASIAVVLAGATLPASAYCLTGIRWPSNTTVSYNPSGKVTGSVQCGGDASAMDSAVRGGDSWSRMSIPSGTTSAKPNRQDGQNTVGWAKLGGGTLGVTNYLNTDRFYNWQCGSNRFANAYEVDVRITTVYRWWTSGSCPCAAGPGYSLKSVAEHEFGHVIGLCHVNQPNSLMYPSFDVCQTKSKGSDETAGENAIYGGSCSPL